MTLILHEHPFASYCWKVLIALYERELAFERRLVDDADARVRLAELWPLASIPVLEDEEAGLTLPESSAIVEHLDGLGAAPPLIPAERAAALQARLWDRVLDGHVSTPMQKVVLDSLRPQEARDAYGVREAHAQLDRAYELLDARLSGRAWLAGERFTLADCSAAPALHYGRVVRPWDDRRLPELTRYVAALVARPSVARVVDEARPYRSVFPLPWSDDVD